MRTLVYPMILALGLTGCIRGELADRETRALCEKDGGIRVGERVQLTPGRFPTIIPDEAIPTWKPVEGVIFGKYRFTDSYETISSHGYNIYKHRKQVKRLDDGKVMAELVQYVRQGEPEFPGIVCPESLTTEKLINSVFYIPDEKTDPYEACPVEKDVLRVASERPATQKQTDTGQTILNLPNNRTWARGINCDERISISLWYEQYGERSTRLAATRLLFFGQNGRRCQAFAIPDSRSVVCTADGVFAIGAKGPSQSVVIQKFTLDGRLKSEAEFAGVAPGLLAGYREESEGITIYTAKTDQRGYADCFASVIDKRDLNSGIANVRLGPPDGPLQAAECMRPRWQASNLPLQRTR